SRIVDLRRAQARRKRRLTAIETELREVVVDIRRRAWLGLLRLAFGCLLDRDLGFVLRVELFRHVLGPLERHVRGVGPEALEIRLTIGRLRRCVGLPRSHGPCYRPWLFKRSRLPRYGDSGHRNCDPDTHDACEYECSMPH